MVKKSLLYFFSLFLVASCAHKKVSNSFSTHSTHGKRKTANSQLNPNDLKQNPTSATKLSGSRSADANPLVELDNLDNKEEALNQNNDFNLSEKDRLFFELSGEQYKDLNEESIFEKLMEKYHNNDLRAMEAYVNLLTTKYPASHLADNALYYEGMLALSSKSYGKSLECFQKVISQYPQSNKVVSAVYAKGILYRKMNLNNESVSILRDLQSRFPGSPESKRAEAELKSTIQY